MMVHLFRLALPMVRLGSLRTSSLHRPHWRLRRHLCRNHPDRRRPSRHPARRPHRPLDRAILPLAAACRPLEVSVSSLRKPRHRLLKRRLWERTCSDFRRACFRRACSRWARLCLNPSWRPNSCRRDACPEDRWVWVVPCSPVPFCRRSWRRSWRRRFRDGDYLGGFAGPVWTWGRLVSFHPERDPATLLP